MELEPFWKMSPRFILIKIYIFYIYVCVGMSKLVLLSFTGPFAIAYLVPEILQGSALLMPFTVPCK